MSVFKKEITSTSKDLSPEKLSLENFRELFSDGRLLMFYLMRPENEKLMGEFHAAKKDLAKLFNNRCNN